MKPRPQSVMVGIDMRTTRPHGENSMQSEKMDYELTLARVAPEMEYGTVTRWLKREGEQVNAGEPLVEIEAEKASHEVDSPVAGVIRSLVAAEGDELEVGGLLAVIETG